MKSLTTQAQNSNIRTLQAILELPEHRIDVALAKLTIDHMIDPGIDIDTNLHRLDVISRWIMEAWQLSKASSVDKLKALRTFLYLACPWNGHLPFRYDFDDPLGSDVCNKLLPNYLATKKGNCMSMPLLFIILGQKLGLDVTASLAPEHIFVKYRDDMGNFFNIEACEKAGPKEDASYQKDCSITPEALANGVYLQPLSKRETVVVTMSTLMEFYNQRNQQEQRIAVAGLALDYFPKDVGAMLHIGGAFFQTLKNTYIDKYPRPVDIPRHQQPYARYLEDQCEAWFAKAESLGWRRPTKDSETAYLEKVKRKQLTESTDAVA